MGSDHRSACLSRAVDILGSAPEYERPRQMRCRPSVKVMALVEPCQNAALGTLDLVGPPSRRLWPDLCRGIPKVAEINRQVLRVDRGV